jgi:hypothetical protein
MKRFFFQNYNQFFQCECKNFARRRTCFRCKKERTINCKIVPVLKQKSTNFLYQGKFINQTQSTFLDYLQPSTSLMVRGAVIPETNEGQVNLEEPILKFVALRNICKICTS